MPIPSICWLAALVALLALEAATVGLVSLWFAVGSLCVIIRPLARKYADPRRESTNADRVVGAEGVVTQAIDNLKAQGQITVNGAPWTARTEEGCPAIPAGSRVRVLRIEGVKVIVSPLPVPTPGR